MRRSDRFTFIDLFAGIGGIRIALERCGGKCLFSSEWDKYAQMTYLENFDDTPSGDITKIPSSKIPDHDVLAAGFPCQPFSIAGISKKKSLNRPVGFDDAEQGTLFFEIIRIMRAKKPKAVLLENVKNLRTHDGGKTFDVIMSSLKKLGYDAHAEVLDAKGLVPQHRERIYIVAFDKKTDFKFPEIPDNKPKLKQILEKNVDKKYTLTKGVWNALKRHAARHKAKGNGFGYGIANPEGYTRTLSARYYKDGGEILISQGRGKRPRRLTPTECARLMGHDNFKRSENVSDHQLYKQFGNSVAIPVLEYVSKAMIKTMRPRRKIVLTNHARPVHKNSE